jgi:hypothetical protein
MNILSSFGISRRDRLFWTVPQAIAPPVSSSIFDPMSRSRAVLHGVRASAMPLFAIACRSVL